MAAAQEHTALPADERGAGLNPSYEGKERESERASERAAEGALEGGSRILPAPPEEACSWISSFQLWRRQTGA